MKIPDLPKPRLGMCPRCLQIGTLHEKCRNPNCKDGVPMTHATKEDVDRARGRIEEALDALKAQPSKDGARRVIDLCEAAARTWASYENELIKLPSMNVEGEPSAAFQSYRDAFYRYLVATMSLATELT